jgi:hypothetical protein
MSEQLFRRNATACYELARSTPTEAGKARWIALAQAWLERAEGANLAGASPPPIEISPRVVQQQQQAQPAKKEE